MVKTSRADLQEDERLATVVSKYPCLYDKKHNDFKEKDRRCNAWREVESELGMEEGMAERKFDVLRKRFTRKRKLASNIAESDTVASIVTPAKREFCEYAFMEWLLPHIAQRKTGKSVLKRNEYAADDMESCDSNAYETDVTKYDELAVMSSLDVHEEEIKQPCIKGREEGIKESELTRDMELITKDRLQSPKQQAEDADTIFGKMIASELRDFSDDVKFEVKHELNNVIYNFKLQERARKQRIQKSFVSPSFYRSTTIYPSPHPASPV